MRVAALYDIHGNLSALDAVLEDVRKASVDQVVIGGDVVLGPMPRETLARLKSLSIPVQFVEGNCDREVRSVFAGNGSPNLPEVVRQNFHWVAGQLRNEEIEELATWPATVSLDIEGLGDVLFCHATPRNDTEIFTRRTSEALLSKVFQGINASVVVCGHTHMQFDRMVGEVRVVNSGSVGMPFGRAGADWLLLGPEVEFRHTEYDLASAADVIRGTSYPQAEDFAENNILVPPGEEAMLAAFAKAELSSGRSSRS